MYYLNAVGDKYSVLHWKNDVRKRQRNYKNISLLSHLKIKNNLK